MTQCYHRTATAQFAINDTDQRITISDVPYIWQPAVNPDMDLEGLYAVRDWARKNLTLNGTLSTVYVSTSPAE